MKLTGFQEAGSENREHLLASESEVDENDTNYEHILAPPDVTTQIILRKVFQAF